MGADLYRDKIFKANYEKYEPKFEAAVKKRNEAVGEKLKDKYQEQVSEYHNKMYEVGYYRDSYNDSNLLWQFGLDYWTWFAAFLNKEGELTPSKAKLVLATLRSLENKVFKPSITKLSEDDAKYFLEKYERFQAFLDGAIEAKEKIDCSI